MGVMKYGCFMAVLDAIDWDVREPNPASCRASIAPIAPRVLLADDQEEILLAIAAMLEEEFDIVGLAENGTQVLDLVLKRSPDVLVLDIFMPVMNGMETATSLRASGCPVKVLFLTVIDDSDFVQSAISMGALGYVLKPHLATDLIPAIRAVLQGRLYVSPCMHWS